MMVALIRLRNMKKLKKTKPTRSTYLKRTVNSSCSKFLVIVKVIKMISIIIAKMIVLIISRQCVNAKMVIPWISLRNVKKLKETKPKQQRQI